MDLLHSKSFKSRVKLPIEKCAEAILHEKNTALRVWSHIFGAINKGEGGALGLNHMVADLF